MKIIMGTFFLSLLSCCAFGQDKAAIAAAEAGCGPEDLEFSVTTDESQHPAPAPENGKALIYVVQNAGTFKFGTDGKWLGALKRGTYFYTSVEPGEHHLCVKGRLGIYKYVALHGLNAKPGETHYFFIRLVSSGYPELFFTEVDPDQGKELVATSKFSSSHPK